jgi:hypothetical protein
MEADTSVPVVDLVSANAVLDLRAAQLRAQVLRAYPTIENIPALEIAVDRAIEQCLRNFNPSRGDLVHYVRSSVGHVVRHFNGATSVELDDNVLQGIDEGTVTLASVIPVASELHRAEMIIDQLPEPTRTQVRVMIFVSDPQARESIFGVAAIERAKLEHALLNQVKQLAAA